MPPRRARPASGPPAEPRLLAELDEVVLDPDRTPDLADARITGIVGDDLDDVVLARCVVEGVRLTAVSLRRIRLTDVVLRDCELSGANLEEAQLVRVRIERCRAAGLDAGLLRATDVVVHETKLSEAGLRMTRWERARLEGCDLRGAELLEASLDHVELTGCDLTRVDLSRARMAEVVFRSCRLDEMKGASALAGASIESSQVVPVAVSLLSELKIRIDDGPGSGVDEA